MLTATKCQCGAITVDCEEAGRIVWTNSMRPATFRREFPGVRLNSKRKYNNCNYCVNHWGLDLCGCGSGEKVGKCNGHFKECLDKTPMQTKGVDSGTTRTTEGWQ